MMPTHSAIVYDLNGSVPVSLVELAQRCSRRMLLGERLITLFGRNADTGDGRGGVIVTAVLQPNSGAMVMLRAQGRAGEQYPSLTASHPCAQIFERELWEQTGVIPQGHPWLKPVRFEGERQQHMADYPFFKVRGPEVHEVGVGPIHASVIEPGHFRFMCLGEKVHHLEIQLGYQHRGVERLLLRRPSMSLAPITESVCGDSSVAYAWGYCAVIEALTASQVTPGVALLRGVALAMARIAIHVATLNGLATDIAFLQGGGTYGRLRTAIINATQRACGNRFGRGWLRPGHARGLTDALRHDLIQTLVGFATDFCEVNDLMLTSPSVRARFKGVGIVSAQTASELGLVGVVARASGVALDARVLSTYPPYDGVVIDMLTEMEGDCWARMQQRMREVTASVSWLLNVLQDKTSDLGGLDRRSGMSAPLQGGRLCVSLIEGARGPVVQVVETSTDGQIVHYKIQDPSLTNWFGLAMALRDQEISDFPICNKSFDLSYCGNDL